MHAKQRLFATLGLLVAGLASAVPAWAEYRLTTVDYPGAIATQLWGINDAGRIVGQAFPDLDTSLSFEYDQRTGEFTVLPAVPGALDSAAIGLNERGTTVGSSTADDANQTRSAYYDDKGTITLVNHPDWLHTNGRAMGSSGVLTGFAQDGTGLGIGFLYNPKTGLFTDIVIPGGRLVIAQGINGRGDVVGSVTAPPNGLFPGSLPGNTAWVRDAKGGMALFRVDGLQTRARGITDSGTIAGFTTDPFTGGFQGYIGKFPLQAGYQVVPGTAVQMVVMPGSASTTLQGINNAGVAVGAWNDGTTDHGLIATPLPGGKP